MQEESPRNRRLKTGHYVGLKFDQGWLFMNVLETEQIDLKPWVLMNGDGERAEIQPESLGYQDETIEDRVGRDLTKPQDSERDLVFQTMVGVSPSRAQIYPRFGRDRMPNLVGGSGSDNPQTPLTGYDSPYNNPTPQGEFLTLDAIDDLSLQGYNPMDEPQEIRISVFVNKFKYGVIENRNLMKALLQGQVNFKAHPMGLGAQQRDQMKAPGWIMDRFGDVIHPTADILDYEGGPQDTSEQSDSQGDDGSMF